MKFLVSQENFLTGLKAISKVISKKSPQHAGVRITTSYEKNAVELSATNFQDAIFYVIDNNHSYVEFGGNVFIQGSTLQTAARSLPEGSLALSLDNKQLQINSGLIQYSLYTNDGAEYKQHKIPDENLAVLTGKELKCLLKNVDYAAATDNSRPIFLGVLFEFDGESATAVATNTHRLARKTINPVIKPQCQGRVVIPKSLLKHVSTFIEDESFVHLRWNESIAVIGDKKIILHTVNCGKYPDWQKIIPQNFSTAIEVSRIQLLQAVTRITGIVKGYDYSIINIEFGQENLKLSGKHPDIGQVTETIPVGYEAGPTLQGISFNVVYLQDALKIINEDMITLSFNTPTSPACIASKNKNDFMHIITPVRTSF
ncbi:DNA polymerase-3 subunit beta [Anaerospora hongkongensis]|uniref:Beta sliding clamp n=1 Tax=Anaerospora hongkongensis TaxID=244830 RepID=A0A4R1QAS5_9FIRM|nr:DNA polymerase III subunit beta [Anaerospora hongkongensis]TCL40025.1 DNA polymerase-3 subunit beta [Anaerospora hongkongensis]